MRCVIDQSPPVFSALSAGSIVIGMHGPGDPLHASQCPAASRDAVASRDEHQACGI